MYSCGEDIGRGLLTGLSKSKHCRPLGDEARTFVSSSNKHTSCLFVYKWLLQANTQLVWLLLFECIKESSSSRKHEISSVLATSRLLTERVTEARLLWAITHDIDNMLINYEKRDFLSIVCSMTLLYVPCNALQCNPLYVCGYTLIIQVYSQLHL